MARITLRFLAYLLAGISLGGASFLALHPQAVIGDQTILVAALIAVFGLAGVIYLLLRASRVPGQGIRITPAFSLAAMDLICLIASALTGFFIFEGLAVRITGTHSSLGDPLVADVMLFMYLPAALILAAFVSASGAQRIGIDAFGIFISGQTDGAGVGWQEIKAFVPDPQFVIVSRIGLPIPRHLRTNMTITCLDGESLKVFEPGLKSTRRQIVKMLQANAPARLEVDIDDIAGCWL